MTRWCARLIRYGGCGFVVWLFAVWPPPSWYRAHAPQRTAFMAMRSRQGPDSPGASNERYEPVALNEIAPSVQQAVIVAEDRRFFEHGGVDYQAVREAIGYRRSEFSWGNPADRHAMWSALTSLWRRRHEVRGASTITQQLAKNLYLSPSRNPLRKVKEAATAYRLESALGKHRILELYLTVVELGPGVWGVGAASQFYFGKPPSRLTAREAALLAATLPSPLSANPSYHPERIRWRRDMILRRTQGYPVAIPPQQNK